VKAVRLAAQGNSSGLHRILHVENDPDIQRIAAAITQELAVFEFAGTLREARARLAQWPFDLVLLDLQLPDGSGWQLVDELDKLRPRPAIVVFTVDDSSTGPDDRVAAILVKAGTSNERFLQTIRDALHDK
jgi:CheY-like chemotaxis protein